MRYTPPVDESAPPQNKRPRVDPSAEDEEDTGVAPSIPVTTRFQYLYSDEGAFSRIFKDSPVMGSKNLMYAAYSTASWRSMEAAWNNWVFFNSSVSMSDHLAPTQKTVSDFVGWLFESKKLKHSTSESYLSSISTILKMKNRESPLFSSYYTKTLLKGGKNLESILDSPKSTRKVMTIELLRILGHEISIANWAPDSKRVFWTACCTLFFGSFRIGEILSSSEKSFDPSSCLLWGDVKFRENSILIHVKMPKVKSKEGDFVDLFEFEEKNCCPVRVLRGLRKFGVFNCSSNLPVFAFASGNLLTPVTFNRTVRTLLSPHLGNTANEYSSHSFRAAISSALAKFPALVTEDEIKCWGRWESAAFKKYTRLKLDQKISLHGKVANALLRRPSGNSGW